jgi:exodeoxyribonuclease VII small subunit
MKNAEEPQELSFEAALARLEAIVARLEAGNLPLDEAVALYEEGMRLVTICGQRLDAAELRVSQLAAAPGGGTEVTPFTEAKG